MSPSPRYDGSLDPLPFACEWQPEGPRSGSVQVRGEVDIATAPRLKHVIADALQHARLVILDMNRTSFMDFSGLHVLLDASAQARRSGAHLLLVTQSPQIATLLQLTGTRASLDILPLPPPADTPSEDAVRRSPGTTFAGMGTDHRADETERWIRPLDNPVNATVVMARAMTVPDRRLWLHASGGVLRRAWIPQAIEAHALGGTPIEVYLDKGGEVNGWREPLSGLAINQRHLVTGASPSDGVVFACQGPCGVLWRVPAPAELAKHDERCLTCAGPLAVV